jgi:hypothetical protein
MNPTKNQVWTHVLQKGKQFLLKMWHPSCYSSYRPGDKSSMGKGSDCNDKKPNVYVVIYDKDTPCRSTKSVATSSQPLGTLDFGCLLVSSNPLIKEIMIGTTSSEISDQLRDIYSIYRCCQNVVTWKWENGNHLFSRKGVFLSAPIVNIEVYIKVWNRPSCICGIIYFKGNAKDVNSKISKLTII